MRAFTLQNKPDWMCCGIIPLEVVKRGNAHVLDPVFRVIHLWLDWQKHTLDLAWNCRCVFCSVMTDKWNASLRRKGGGMNLVLIIRNWVLLILCFLRSLGDSFQAKPAWQIHQSRSRNIYCICGHMQIINKYRCQHNPAERHSNHLHKTWSTRFDVRVWWFYMMQM